MENQHRLVKGYRDLSQREIDAMNSIKLAEQDIGQLFQQVRKLDGVDQRIMAITKTKLQEAFSWFVRAVAQPLDVYELYIEEPPAPTFLDRLKTEVEQVTTNVEKLSAFADSDAFTKLPVDAQDDLLEQLDHMRKYASVLSRRKEKLGGA